MSDEHDEHDERSAWERGLARMREVYGDEVREIGRASCRERV